MKRTPLYEQHRAAGARLTDFGGWEMPTWYAGIKAEHEAVRTKVGLFDVSHMGEFVVYGADAERELRRLLTNDVAELDIDQAQYTLMPNAEGGTVDDLLAYRLGVDVYLLVVNAANIEKDFAWLESQLEGQVRIDDGSSDKALLALQGPLAPTVLSGLTRLPIWGMGYYHFARGEVDGAQVLVSRTGYTGEDGFEIMCEPEDAPGLWDALLAAGEAHGIQPCGLGARDSLRLESAMPLYGHELDDTISVVEAGLKRFVELEKPGLDVPMMGEARFRREVEEGLTRRLVGLEIEGRGIPRQGFAIHAQGEPVGVVTSGTMSPSLGKAIALGYVPPAHGKLGTELEIDVRGRAVPARTVRRPFYRRKR